MLNLVGQLVLIACILASVSIFSKMIYTRFKLVMSGQKDEKRWDNPVKRLGYVVAKIGSQMCSIKDRPVTGIMHAFVFYGFVFFSIVTVNHTIGAFVEDFSLFGHGIFNTIWYGGVEIISILTIIGILFLAVRRYFVKPEGISKPTEMAKSPHSAVVIVLIFGLMVTYLFTEAIEIVLYSQGTTSWMPMSQATTVLFNGLAAPTLHLLFDIFWWMHILFVLIFLPFIPHSKHFHLLAGPINIFFQRKENITPLKSIDFETVEEFGVTNINNYQWKNLVDFMACVNCGRCQDECPAYQSGKALSPKTLMMKQRKHLMAEAPQLFKGEDPSEPIMEKWMTQDEIWACTTCGACMEACPVSNEHIPTIIELRRAQMMMENNFPTEMNATFKGLETNSNPWNLGSAARADWTEDLDVPMMSDVQEADYLWYVGCAGSFDDKGKEISKSVAKILNKAGVSYAILGVEEGCCGDSARRAGNEYLYQMLAETNIETMKQYKFKKILTTCPHGYNILKNEYNQFGGEYEVVHHSELISELLKDGKISVNSNGFGKMTFHDSCYLGRYNDIYSQPRAILESVSDGKLVEMESNKAKSFCCGAGGARMFMEETEGTRINHMRVDEAKACGAETIGVACPFCMTMIDDGIKEKGYDEKLKVFDIAQIIAKQL